MTKPLSPAGSVIFLLFLIVFVPLSARARGFTPLLFEAKVFKALRTIHSAEAAFQSTAGNGNFGSLESLSTLALVDPALGTGLKYGYIFKISKTDLVPGPGGAPARFTLTATPAAYRKTGVRSFFIDQTGFTRGGDKSGSDANAADPQIEDCALFGSADNERCTASDLRSLVSIETRFASTNWQNNYGTFEELHNASLIRDDMATGPSRGYYYAVTVYFAVLPDIPSRFQISATPADYGVTGRISYFIDQTGVLRGGDKNGQRAGASDPPISDPGRSTSLF